MNSVLHYFLQFNAMQSSFERDARPRPLLGKVILGVCSSFAIGYKAVYQIWSL